MLIQATMKPKRALSTILKELGKGSSDSRHPFRYVSLASYNPERQETNIRMLVLREVREDGTVILYTDVRTEKVREMSAIQNAGLLFWHERHKVQVTVKADAVLHHNEEISEEYWKKDVHGPAQKAYTPLVAPGTSISEPAEAYRWPEEYTDEHFCVIRCIPREIQILQLGGKEHLRLQFSRDGVEKEWEGGWIAP